MRATATVTLPVGAFFNFTVYVAVLPSRTDTLVGENTRPPERQGLFFNSSSSKFSEVTLLGTAGRQVSELPVRSKVSSLVSGENTVDGGDVSELLYRYRSVSADSPENALDASVAILLSFRDRYVSLDSPEKALAEIDVSELLSRYRLVSAEENDGSDVSKLLFRYRSVSLDSPENTVEGSDVSELFDRSSVVMLVSPLKSPAFNVVVVELRVRYMLVIVNRSALVI